MADQLDAQSQEQQQRLQQAEAAAATQSQDMARLALNVGACIRSAVSTTARLAGLPAPASASSYSYLSSLLAPIPLAAAPAARPTSAFVSLHFSGPTPQLAQREANCCGPAASVPDERCPPPYLPPLTAAAPSRLQDVCMSEYDSFIDVLRGRAADEGRQAGRSSPPPAMAPPSRQGGSRCPGSSSPSIRSSLDRQLLMGLNLVGGYE
jgi:hypothetical protein